MNNKDIARDQNNIWALYNEEKDWRKIERDQAEAKRQAHARKAMQNTTRSQGQQDLHFQDYADGKIFEPEDSKREIPPGHIEYTDNEGNVHLIDITTEEGREKKRKLVKKDKDRGGGTSRADDGSAEMARRIEDAEGDPDYQDYLRAIEDLR